MSQNAAYDQTFEKIAETMKATLSGASNAHPGPLGAVVLGGPGSGKVAGFRAAAAKTASDLGLKFLQNPAVDGAIVIGGKDLVFISIELPTPEKKGFSFGVDARTEEEAKAAHKILTRVLEAAKNASAVVLVLDDLTELAPNVSNAVISSIEPERLARLGLSNVFVGATGPQGANVPVAVKGRFTIHTLDSGLSGKPSVDRIRLQPSDAEKNATQVDGLPSKPKSSL